MQQMKYVTNFSGLEMGSFYNGAKTKRRRELVLTYIIALAVVASNLIFSERVLTASSAETNVLAGVVWQDENNNGVYEPSEESLSDAWVYARAVNSEEVFSAVTSDEGLFALDLPYGDYEVWATFGRSVVSSRQTVRIDEVMGQVFVELPVPLSSEEGFMLFVPFVLR